MAKTGELPLKGGTDGQLKSLDGKLVLSSDPDPLAVERARDYAYALEKAEDMKEKAACLGLDLLDVLLKTKRAPSVAVQTERRKYRFSVKSLTKLVAEKKSK